MPLFDYQKICERQNVVQFLIENEDIRAKLATSFSQIGDLERMSAKVATDKISPREMNQLKNTLLCIKQIKLICQSEQESPLYKDSLELDSCDALCDEISTTLCEDAPAMLGKGPVIAKGVNDELDKLRDILYSGKDYLLNLQRRESENTGISSLKVGYNNIFGYYIEVRNTYKDKVPEGWIRKQTLVNAERYITEELKEYESQILGAEEKIQTLESQLYSALVATSTQYLQQMQISAKIAAKIDILLSFADTAILHKYCKPGIFDDDILDIKQGRHPVIESQLPADNPYIPNDVFLDTSSQQIMIITGPNMSGKSALLRQTAIIVLMAQIGSYVPAEAAHIGIVDRIFTRVGASDNISQGESTFMVEMIESAGILNNITGKSLVLLDEIGRGTSTYDGISIAWAMVEFLHEHPTAKAKTLFATHYHELNEMERSYSRVVNYNVSIKESGNKIIFLRQLVPGGSAHSFGIHVAKMAGMPKSVIARAEEILKQLESGRDNNKIPSKSMSTIADKREGYQLSFFQLDDPVLKQIRDELVKLDINSLTPIEALNKLNEIRALVGGKNY